MTLNRLGTVTVRSVPQLESSLRWRFQFSRNCKMHLIATGLDLPKQASLSTNSSMQELGRFMIVACARRGRLWHFRRDRVA